MVGEFLALLVAHCSLTFQVSLITNQNFRYVTGTVLLNFVHPRLHPRKREPVSHVVRHDDTVCAPVVARCDCLEAILASCVPNLQFDLLVVNLSVANFEVHSNRRVEIIIEGILLFATISAGFNYLRRSEGAGMISRHQSCQ